MLAIVSISSIPRAYASLSRYGFNALLSGEGRAHTRLDSTFPTTTLAIPTKAHMRGWEWPRCQVQLSSGLGGRAVSLRQTRSPALWLSPLRGQCLQHPSSRRSLLSPGCCSDVLCSHELVDIRGKLMRRDMVPVFSCLTHVALREPDGRGTKMAFSARTARMCQARPPALSPDSARAPAEGEQ